MPLLLVVAVDEDDDVLERVEPLERVEDRVERLCECVSERKCGFECECALECECVFACECVFECECAFESGTCWIASAAAALNAYGSRSACERRDNSEISES